MEQYTEFAVQKAVELLAIDSPTGYTAEAEAFVQREFAALGFSAVRGIVWRVKNIEAIFPHLAPPGTAFRRNKCAVLVRLSSARLQ